ncbi:hypothetical protein Pelo_14959 [Pelomyxa schiedti]|nr:hypothetical protein Pelo_14959 [Pelomyxa schiedti]
MTEYVPAGVSAEGLDDRVWHLLYKVFREEVLEPVDVLVDPRVLEELAQMPDGPDRVRRLVQVIKSHMSQIMGACGPAFSTWAADCVNEAWKGSGATYVPRKYVDLGCGKGDKTASIAKKFNIESQNVVGFEVACSHYNETERTTFTFKTCADGARLPGIEDASIDLVTILMTLHHSVNQNAVLQENICHSFLLLTFYRKLREYLHQMAGLF